MCLIETLQIVSQKTCYFILLVTTDPSLAAVIANCANKSLLPGFLEQKWGMRQRGAFPMIYQNPLKYLSGRGKAANNDPYIVFWRFYLPDIDVTESSIRLRYDLFWIPLTKGADFFMDGLDDDGLQNFTDIISGKQPVHYTASDIFIDYNGEGLPMFSSFSFVISSELQSKGFAFWLLNAYQVRLDARSKLYPLRHDVGTPQS